MLARDWKRAPWGLLLALAIMAFVQAPCLDARLYDDDYAQLAAARGLDEPTLAARSLLDLYRFFPGDVEAGRALMRHGAVPWWFEPSTQMSFFRPLSCALMVLDARVLGDRTTLYHAHSMLWCAALLVAFWALARRVTPRSAELAVCLFAASRYSVSLGAVWWCNRHLVVSATFACVALWALARWRLEAWRPGRWIAPMAIILALLGGESGLQVFAYVGAFELFVSRRAHSVAMVGAGAVLYLLVRIALGYGTRGESIYRDPLHEPGRWLSLVLSRGPSHVAAVLGGGLPAWPMGLLLVAIAGHAIMDKAIARPTLAWLLVGSLVRVRADRGSVARGRPRCGERGRAARVCCYRASRVDAGARWSQEMASSRVDGERARRDRRGARSGLYRARVTHRRPARERSAGGRRVLDARGDRSRQDAHDGRRGL